jgi:hypothetical protein
MHHSKRRARVHNFLRLRCRTARAPTFAERDSWNSRQRGRALWHATRDLFETLCFQNGLGGRRGKEHDQRSCGVSLTVAGNDAGGELGVVLNR